MLNRNKRILLSSGLFTIFKAYRRYLYYIAYCSLDIEDIPIEVLPYESFQWYVDKYPRLFRVFCNMCSSKCQKVKRVHKRLLDMMYTDDGELKDCLFLTLTWKDEVLQSTSQKTRRVYVTRYLKSQYTNYIANIDFGGKFGREHYHCIIGSDHVSLPDWFTKYGIINVEYIKTGSRKIAQYINKLCYHTTKVENGYLIYSRNNTVAKAD